MSTYLDQLKTEPRTHHHTVEGEYILSTGRSAAESWVNSNTTTVTCTQGDANFQRYHNRIGGPVLAKAPVQDHPLPGDGYTREEYLASIAWADDPAPIAWERGLEQEVRQLVRDAEESGLVVLRGFGLVRRLALHPEYPEEKWWEYRKPEPGEEHNTIVVTTENPEPDTLAGKPLGRADGWLALANRIKQACSCAGLEKINVDIAHWEALRGKWYPLGWPYDKYPRSELLKERIKKEVLGLSGRAPKPYDSFMLTRYGSAEAIEDNTCAVAVAYWPGYDSDWHRELEQIGRILDELEMYDVEVVFKPGRARFC